MKIKTSELTGIALDWFVAKCGGELYPRGCVRLHSGRLFTIDPGDSETLDAWRKYEPSTDPVQGHSIIEWEKINIEWWNTSKSWHACCNEALQYDDKGEFIDGSNFHFFGPTPLIAAMRCYVASKLGEEVDVPEELCGDIK